MAVVNGLSGKIRNVKRGQNRMSFKNALGKRRGSENGSRALAAVLALLAWAGAGWAAGKPTTVAEIALYQGPDREQLLIEGAKKEGQMMFYNPNTWLAAVASDFEKKYPFVKVSVWRSDSANVIKRAVDEYASGRFLADVVENTPEFVAVLHKKGILQEYFSPESAAYGDEVKTKGKTGIYYMADRENYTSLGFNTKLVPSADAPKTYKNLLDARWKGKMSIVNTFTGIQWVGNALNVMGREYLEKLSRQEIKVQNMSAVTLAGLVVSGEVPLSPTILDSNMFTSKKTGAPLEWWPLEPVVANLGCSGMTIKAPHPHSALLFLDYFYSKEGQKVVIKGGLSSPREDIGSLEQKFTKTYLEAKYSFEEYEKKYTEWEELMRQLFIRKR